MAQSRTVYVVDDDRAVLDSMAFLLQSFDYSTDLFPGPAAFLGSADGLRPGCIVTDLRMPGMTGCELLSALRSRSIDWPVILMTGDDRPDSESRARSLGFAALLRKPVDADALLAALENAFAALAH